MHLCLGVAHTVLPRDAVTLLGSRQDPELPGHLPKALQTPTPTPGIQHPQHSSHTHPQPLQEASLAWSRRYSYRQAVSGRWDPEGFLQEGATKLSWGGGSPPTGPLPRAPLLFPQVLIANLSGQREGVQIRRPVTAEPLTASSPQGHPQASPGWEARGVGGGQGCVAPGGSSTCPWAQTRAGRRPVLPAQSWAKGASALWCEQS